MISQLFMEHVSQSEMERVARIKQAWAYYHNDMPKPLKVLPGGQDDNIILGFAKLIVNKGVSFLIGTGVGVEVDCDDSGSTEQSTADAWASEFWERNHGCTTQQMIAINGAVCGHTFAKLNAPKRRGDMPRIIVLDPQNVKVITDPEDYEQVIRYIVQWSGVDPNTGRPITRRQITERQDNGRWQITDTVSSADSTSWQQIAQDIWPYDWCPISQCQNYLLPNVFWGQSDIETELIAANNALNFSISNIGRILRFHAHPKTWGSGFRAADLDVSIDELISFPNPEAKLSNLEMTSDLSSSIEFYVRLKEAFHELARVPEIATGKVDNVGALSGVALQILYQPLIEATKDKQVRYGGMFEELTLHALEMGGQGADHEITLHWPEPLPADPLAEAQAAQVWQEVGVSRATLLERAGYDPEAEAAKRQEEADVAAANFQQAGAGAMAQFDRGRMDAGANAQ